MAKTYQLTGVETEGEILIFGGASNASYNMYRVKEDGKVVADLSKSGGQIPGAMCSGVRVVLRGKLLAVGWRNISGEWRSEAQAFTGTKWETIGSR